MSPNEDFERALLGSDTSSSLRVVFICQITRKECIITIFKRWKTGKDPHVTIFYFIEVTSYLLMKLHTCSFWPANRCSNSSITLPIMFSTICGKGERVFLHLQLIIDKVVGTETASVKNKKGKLVFPS